MSVQKESGSSAQTMKSEEVLERFKERGEVVEECLEFGRVIGLGKLVGLPDSTRTHLKLVVVNLR